MILKKRNFCPFCDSEIRTEVACSFCCNILKNLINRNTTKTKNCFYITAPFIYKNIIRDAILKFKFEKKKEFCKSFCYFMAMCEVDFFDVLVCVPTFEKEFNSSKELSKVLSKKINVKFYEDAVIKIKKTKCQHNCNLKERLINLEKAFKADERRVFGKNVLICDDIITTKSTVREIAESLKEAGAKRVGAISFAISEKLPFLSED